MAQLKDTIITGDASITGTLYPAKIQGNTLWIPTSSGGTTYGAGTSGQVLKTNGTTVYWASLGTLASKSTISDHTTGSVGSASGWSAGTASSWTFEEKSIPNVTAAGSASTWTFEEKTIPNVTAAGSASTWTFEEKTIPNVTAAGSGSFTSGAFSGGSGSFSATVTNHVLSYSHTHTAATHGADSHTHTAPTIGTAIKVQSKSGGGNGTAPTLGTAIKVQSKSGGGNGSAPTLGTAIKVQSKSGGGNGTAPSLTVTSTTVVTGKTHTLS